MDRNSLLGVGARKRDVCSPSSLPRNRGEDVNHLDLLAAVLAAITNALSAYQTNALLTTITTLSCAENDLQLLLELLEPFLQLAVHLGLCLRVGTHCARGQTTGCFFACFLCCETACVFFTSFLVFSRAFPLALLEASRDFRFYRPGDLQQQRPHQPTENSTTNKPLYPLIDLFIRKCQRALLRLHLRLGLRYRRRSHNLTQPARAATTKSSDGGSRNSRATRRGRPGDRRCE